MLANLEFKISGAEALKQILEKMTPLLRRRYLRKALFKGGEVVKKRASQVGIVPVLTRPVYRKGEMIRKPGTLRDNILVRNSKDAAREGNVGVFVNVLPAKGANRGTNNPNDPFYWRWVNFQHRSRSGRVIPGKHFLEAGGQMLQGPALRAIEEQLKPDIQNLNLRFE